MVVVRGGERAHGEHGGARCVNGLKPDAAEFFCQSSARERERDERQGTRTRGMTRRGDVLDGKSNGRERG